MILVTIFLIDQSKLTMMIWHLAGNGIIAMDAKLGGGLQSLPTIAIQKVAINHMSQHEQDLIGDELSQFPHLAKNGQKNGHHNHNGVNHANGMFTVTRKGEPTFLTIVPLDR